MIVRADASKPRPTETAGAPMRAPRAGPWLPASASAHPRAGGLRSASALAHPAEPAVQRREDCYVESHARGGATAPTPAGADRHGSAVAWVQRASVA